MLSRHSSVLRIAAIATTVSALVGSAFAADKKYDPGASDTEIKLGQTIPYSGAGSLYGVIGRTYYYSCNLEIRWARRAAA